MMERRVFEDRREMALFALSNPGLLAVVVYDNNFEPGLPPDDATPNSVITISLRRRQEGVAVGDSTEVGVLTEAYEYSDQTVINAIPQARQLRRFTTAYEVAGNLRRIFREGSVFIAQSVAGAGLNILSDEGINQERFRADTMALKGIRISSLRRINRARS